MKATAAIKLFMLSFLILGTVSGWAQECDDLYFNRSDRNKTKTQNTVVAKNTSETNMQSPSFNPQTYGDETVNYSAKHVNPEYIARYKNKTIDETFGSKEEGEDFYYVEEADSVKELPDEKDYTKYHQRQFPSAYHYSRDPWLAYNYYGRSFYDPFMSWGYNPGWNMGIGYTFGYMPGWNMSFGYGTGGWGYNPYGMIYNPYRYYNPYYSMYYDPWMSSMYDPWYGGGYYSSCYSCNSWNWYSRYNYGGYYWGSYYPHTYTDNYNSRYVRYGKRTARGSNLKSVDGTLDRTKHYVQRERTSENDGGARVSTTDQRDYSAIQNEYYGRSRKSAYTERSTRTVSTRETVGNTSTRSTVGTTSPTRSRVTRDNSNYSRPSYKNSSQERGSSYNRLNSYNSRSTTRSYNSSGYQNSRSSSRSYSNAPSSNYSSSGSFSSGSRSSSYSSGSRSSGSYSSGRSSSPSRGRH